MAQFKTEDDFRVYLDEGIKKSEAEIISYGAPVVRKHCWLPPARTTVRVAA